ncbi:hypothetical protein ACLOJK_012151 [Asimina triloba]
MNHRDGSACVARTYVWRDTSAPAVSEREFQFIPQSSQPRHDERLNRMKREAVERSAACERRRESVDGAMRGLEHQLLEIQRDMKLIIAQLNGLRGQTSRQEHSPRFADLESSGPRPASILARGEQQPTHNNGHGKLDFSIFSSRDPCFQPYDTYEWKRIRGASQLHDDDAIEQSQRLKHCSFQFHFREEKRVGNLDNFRMTVDSWVKDPTNNQREYIDIAVEGGVNANLHRIFEEAIVMTVKDIAALIVSANECTAKAEHGSLQKNLALGIGKIVWGARSHSSTDEWGVLLFVEDGNRSFDKMKVTTMAPGPRQSVSER